MNLIKLFFTLYFISWAMIFALQRKSGVPFTIPGDIYIHIAQKKIYLPISSSLVLTIILFLLLTFFGKLI
ncbi:hypothetical protein A2863_01975 [Candidatus Woesebacteria bacterium RIFCSPHIGHO2_01_FULL_38_9b]|uniref:DUF2905 domain-containing protein n=1 Tax=Candidatus Woesebacteria bacterium RIFCSPHIGHO2_01_FULL_38_9b TaxID=1802493 RepID=A0A1F7Y097_9BACT|nr:MAG: hypothetical protein A2863_01975 [Candidatus Woesebacteria bacterium RIFCSPHIGHO2_01_FULL_38_9b]